ncbi:cytochrome B561 [Pseudogulbenkiania sp. NH8B]|uniref:cytochrome b n=1 Tax=Pseudogulbenkiania sp. (strain NH8B) TaxID=748280 RepID=UPI000227A4BE|nr:cytochrome b [Pseudogulbenkiania sp. NH8B]BAK78788.1 cytochrome B561 [Pseudogulbenkiania sp. NH8B]
MLKNSQHSYGWLARALHWLSALAIIAALAFIEFKDVFPKGTPLRDAMKFGHFQAGLIVLLLVLPRLLWRLGNRVPEITPAPHRHSAVLAKLAHWVLYALMLALPLLGIAIVQGSGHELAFFGQPLPVLFTLDRATAHDLKEVHETLGNVLLWLVIGHAAAAVWHHRFVKDNTLTRLTGPLR